MWNRGRSNDASTPKPTESSSLTDSLICDGRFRLEDRILGDQSEGLWRAFDIRLGRPVSVRLIPPSNPDLDALRTVACQAARVVDPRVARVLDVLDSDGTLVIVTEWIDGTPLEQVLRSRQLSVWESVVIARDVAATLAQMHSIGAAHGRIRPTAVMLTEDGAIRLRGHGIDRALWGSGDVNDPITSDIVGLGALLTACLTRRWPLDTPTELQRTPVVGSFLAAPSQVRADLPAELDLIALRALSAGTVRQLEPTARPYTKIEQGYADLAHFADQSGPIAVVTSPERPRRRHVDNATFLRRSGLVAGLAAVAVAGLLISARVFIEDPSSTAASASNATASRPSSSLTGSGVQAGAGTVSPVTEYRIPILRALAVRDGVLDRADRSSAVTVDNDAASSWPVTSDTPIDEQSPSGVIIDLGSPRPVRAITLGLIGNNTDLAIYASNALRKDLGSFHLVSRVEGAPAFMTLRQPKPITNRYLFIALTQVPKQGDEYLGGIATIQVFSG